MALLGVSRDLICCITTGSPPAGEGRWLHPPSSRFWRRRDTAPLRRLFRGDGWRCRPNLRVPSPGDGGRSSLMHFTNSSLPCPKSRLSWFNASGSPVVGGVEPFEGPLLTCTFRLPAPILPSCLAWSGDRDQLCTSPVADPLTRYQNWIRTYASTWCCIYTLIEQNLNICIFRIQDLWV